MAMHYFTNGHVGNVLAAEENAHEATSIDTASPGRGRTRSNKGSLCFGRFQLDRALPGVGEGI